MNIDNTDEQEHDLNSSEININLAYGENEFFPIVNILNIFNIYYNQKSKEQTNLFNGTNSFNKHSINNRMIDFMEEIRMYKLIPDPFISENKDDFSSSNKIFQLKIEKQMCSIAEDEEYDNNELYYCNSIIPLMIYLNELHWKNIKWDINQID